MQVRVFEKLDVLGGHTRTDWLGDIPYEPHGAHIFHTDDEEIWRLVSGLVDFAPYRHRVLIRVNNELLSWPLQVSELSTLPYADELHSELRARPAVPDPTNFETYCRSLLGDTLYQECIRGYTLKQWGRDPDSLAASVAIGRIELRHDGYRDLFRDRFQGWPRHGYTSLVEAFLDGTKLHLGARVTIHDVPALTSPGEPIVVTSALDDFFAEPGSLSWRGVQLQPQLLVGVTLAQPAMVINEPGLDVKWTRSVETKWALEDLHNRPDTVVMREYPGSDAKHYPVVDAQGRNRSLHADLCRRAGAYRRNPLYLVGRLATYRYINMDAAIRSGLESAARIVDGH